MLFTERDSWKTNGLGMQKKSSEPKPKEQERLKKEIDKLTQKDAISTQDRAMKLGPG